MGVNGILIEPERYDCPNIMRKTIQSSP